MRMGGQTEGAVLVHPGEETTWDVPKSSSWCPQVHQRDEARLFTAKCLVGG